MLFPLLLTASACGDTRPRGAMRLVDATDGPARQAQEGGLAPLVAGGLVVAEASCDKCEELSRAGSTDPWVVVVESIDGLQARLRGVAPGRATVVFRSDAGHRTEVAVEVVER